MRRYCSMMTDDFDKMYRKWAGGFCGHELDSTDVAIYNAIGPVRSVLYSGDVTLARTRYYGVVGEYGTNAHTRYILAEINRYDERYAEAKAGYRWVVENAPHDSFIPLKETALLRWGEMEIALGDFETAEDVYKEAKDSEPEESMFSNMIRGRLQYIKDQKERDES